MELKKYVNEIINIAIANNMSWDIGLDMFVANIQNHGVENAPYYAGAGDFDYGAIRDEWMALSLDEKGAAKNEFSDWYRANKINKGLWSAAMVKMAVKKGVITKEQYEEITGKAY